MSSIPLYVQAHHHRVRVLYCMWDWQSAPRAAHSLKQQRCLHVQPVAVGFLNFIHQTTSATLVSCLEVTAPLKLLSFFSSSHSSTLKWKMPQLLLSKTLYFFWLFTELSPFETRYPRSTPFFVNAFYTFICENTFWTLWMKGAKLQGGPWGLRPPLVTLESPSWLTPYLMKYFDICIFSVMFI